MPGIKREVLEKVDEHNQREEPYEGGPGSGAIIVMIVVAFLLEVPLFISIFLSFMPHK